jgi:hypothetical protein
MAVSRDPYFKPARAWGGTCICHIRRLFADVPHTLSTAIFWALYEGTIRFFIRPRGAGAVQLQAGALAAPPRSAAASHISLGSKVSGREHGQDHDCPQAASVATMASAKVR